MKCLQEEERDLLPMMSNSGSQQATPLNEQNKLFISGSRSDTRLFSDCNKGNMSQPFDSTREHGSRPWGLVNTQPSQRVNERSLLSNMSNIMNGTSSGIRRNNMLFSDCNKQNMSQQSDLTREHVNANDYNIGASSRPIGGVFTTPVYQSQNAIDPFSRVSNDNLFNAGRVNSSSRSVKKGLSLNKCQKRILGETLCQSQIPLSHPG
ncbi:hypothetical protein ACET3Z_018043 [Daucus carota]